MLSERELFDLAARVQRKVRIVAGLLSQPSLSNVLECAADLEETVSCLQRLQSDLAPGTRTISRLPAFNDEIASLRREVLRAHTLLEQALAFQTGWMRMAISGLRTGETGGYGPTGGIEAGPAVAASRVASWEG
ncbi:MAG: hypothetical protein WD696_18370 [Bryobacteraceae bacterium]